MHFGAIALHHAMQDAARFIRMVGHVLVARRRDRKAADQRIAMVTMVIHRIHAIRGVLAFAGEELVLALRRPVGRVFQRQQVMPALHFLQEDDVGLERGQGLLERVHPRPAAQGGDALVDVVGGDAQLHEEWSCSGLCCLPAGTDGPTRRGNCNIASAFDGEKHLSAASRHGSQTASRCSLGDKVTGMSRGTCTLKTCSVLRVTPGA